MSMCVMNPALQLRANISFLLHLPTPESNNLQLLQRFTQSSDYQLLTNQRMLSIISPGQSEDEIISPGQSEDRMRTSLSGHISSFLLQLCILPLQGVQGELGGGRNRFWHLKNTEFLCLHGPFSTFWPANRGKDNWGGHFVLNPDSSSFKFSLQGRLLSDLCTNNPYYGSERRFLAWSSSQQQNSRDCWEMSEAKRKFNTSVASVLMMMMKGRRCLTLNFVFKLSNFVDRFYH